MCESSFALLDFTVAQKQRVVDGNKHYTKWSGYCHNFNHKNKMKNSKQNCTSPRSQENAFSCFIDLNKKIKYKHRMKLQLLNKLQLEKLQIYLF